jgi:hypothetical protein
VVCLAGAPATARLAPAPPVHLSLAEVRLVLRAVLPLPPLDVPATLDLLRYQHWRKMAAYLSHRRRILRRLAALPRSEVSL